MARAASSPPAQQPSIPESGHRSSWAAGSRQQTADTKCQTPGEAKSIYGQVNTRQRSGSVTRT